MNTNLVDLLELRRDENQDDLYDLFVQSFKNVTTGLYVTVITRKYEMRLDLLCVDLYGSAKYIGMIMKINDIFNPFSVKIGDVIAYVPSETLSDSLYTDPKLLDEQKAKLVNVLKTSKTDANRRKFLDSIGVPPALPPTVAPDGASKSVIENGKILIAPYLFNNPNDDVGISDPITDTGLGDITSGDSGLGQDLDDTRDIVISDGGVTRGDVTDTADEIERVLVKRFIRSGQNVIESETFDTNSTDDDTDNESAGTLS